VLLPTKGLTLGGNSSTPSLVQVDTKWEWPYCVVDGDLFDFGLAVGWDSHQLFGNVSISVLLDLASIKLLLHLAGALVDALFAHFFEVVQHPFSVFAVLFQEFVLVGDYVFAVLHLFQQVGSKLLSYFCLFVIEVEGLDYFGLVGVDP